MKRKRKNKNSQNIESPSELYLEYDWYENLFPLALQKSCDGFFFPGLRCDLIGVSKNINLLQVKDTYFVTKVRIDKFYDLYLRMSSECIALLLNKGLGRAGRPFNAERLSDLEKSLLTEFSDYVSRIIIPFLEPPPLINFIRTNFDMTQLTFMITDEEDVNLYGKFIISIPDGRLSPDKIKSTGDKFSFEDFYDCPTSVRLVIGKTRFSVDDLKSLEVGDLVIFEESSIDQLKLYVQNEEKIVHINPNPNIELPFNNNTGGDIMSEKTAPKNLWDTIEVDMYAELDPIKIPLGELKKIELGQVVDVAALYENKVSLRVENKVIGHGELVIVNDRYGVKISDILKTENPIYSIQNDPMSEYKSLPASDDENQNIEENENSSELETENEVPETMEGQQNSAGNDEEFDYSDFELEDEDI